MLEGSTFLSIQTLRSKETKTPISKIKLSKTLIVAGNNDKRELYSINCFDLQFNQMVSTNLAEVSQVYLLG